MVLSDLSDQRMTDEDVVDQFLAPRYMRADALGFGDVGADLTAACRSPWSGWLKPAVLLDPRGAEDLGGGGLDSSLRSPSTITDTSWSLVSKSVAAARTVTASAARR